ncbi:protein FAM180A [Salarias fasciatus]|uniref:Protein FAM180A-like n=1 Tax=Salarias fasciatus TaxID=181472 RepID=A0A672F6D7_SALFA|nr:protein FAM180A-like [Salarias fasciatus]XP_029969549.1 protein FAM180A-like [Salarias fasciatus]
MQWRALLVFAYLSASIHEAGSQHYGKALFPSASRIKRGTPALMNPTFQHSVDDANLLFEILLAGMEIRGGGRSLLIPDEELASLSCVEKLEVLCEDVLPKTLPDVRRLAAELERRRTPLSRADFERTVLTLVFSAQTAAQVADRHQREMWTDAALRLFRAVRKDLEL